MSINNLKPIDINIWPGCHDSKGPIVGSRPIELVLIGEAIKNEPILGDFETVLYYQDKSDSLDCLVESNRKEEADQISRNIFSNYLKKHESAGITVDNAIDWTLWGPAGATSIKDDEFRFSRNNQIGIWHVHAQARKSNSECFIIDGKYLSPYLAAYHEILHVEQIPPLSSSKFIELHKHHGSELLQKIKTIILADEVYKQIHGIGIAHEVDYHKSIKLGHKQISIGSIAYFYRSLEERYGTLCDAVLSPASIGFLK